MTTLNFTRLPRSHTSQPAGRVAGGLSIALVVVSVAINLFGYHLSHPAVGPCPLTEMWRGVLLAVASMGTAGAAAACGLAGAVGRGTDRRLALIGLAATAAFLAMFYVLWLNVGPAV